MSKFEDQRHDAHPAGTSVCSLRHYSIMTCGQPQPTAISPLFASDCCQTCKNDVTCDAWSYNGNTGATQCYLIRSGDCTSQTPPPVKTASRTAAAGWVTGTGGTGARSRCISKSVFSPLHLRRQHSHTESTIRNQARQLSKTKPGRALVGCLLELVRAGSSGLFALDYG